MVFLIIWSIVTLNQIGQKVDTCNKKKQGYKQMGNVSILTIVQCNILGVHLFPYT
jgi:hypothetical protein